MILPERSCFISALLLFFFLLLNACCKKEESSGDIISDIDLDEINLRTQVTCYNLPDKLCIRDDSTFHAIFRVTSSNTSCDTIHLPAVDFSQNSVLIYLKSTNDNRRFQRQVTIDKDNKTVYYIMNSSKCTCVDVCETTSLNMVLVPKIPVDYKVEFQ